MYKNYNVFKLLGVIVFCIIVFINFIECFDWFEISISLGLIGLNVTLTCLFAIVFVVLAILRSIRIIFDDKDLKKYEIEYGFILTLAGVFLIFNEQIVEANSKVEELQYAFNLGNLFSLFYGICFIVYFGHSIVASFRKPD